KAMNEILKDQSLMCPPCEKFKKDFQSDSYTYVNIHEKNDTFQTLKKTLEKVANQVLNDKAKLLASLIQHNHSGKNQGIAWHQDIDPSLVKFEAYNFIIYPEDCYEKSGPLYFVPGSHLGKKLPPGDGYDHLPGQVMIIPKAGDLIILNCKTFHSVPRNNSNISRFSINMRFRHTSSNPELLTVGIYRTGRCDYSGKINFDDDNAKWFLSDSFKYQPANINLIKEC
ncbi:MAG: phytanoyl-CoA dioxygenase family protein, partial [Pseudomonadota bacterium]